MITQFSRSQVDEELYLVLRTIFHYERSINSKVGLDYQQIYALQFLRRNDNARLTEIAAELELPMFTTSRMIDRLEAKGYLSKEQDTKDRRNLHIHLQPAGEAILKMIEDSSFERISQNVEKLDHKEIEELMGLAQKLHVILGVSEKVNK